MKFDWLIDPFITFMVSWSYNHDFVALKLQIFLQCAAERRETGKIQNLLFNF